MEALLNFFVAAGNVKGAVYNANKLVGSQYLADARKMYNNSNPETNDLTNLINQYDEAQKDQSDLTKMVTFSGPDRRNNALILLAKIIGRAPS